MTDESLAAPLSADAPIPNIAGDAFGRDRLARRVAVEATAASPDNGLVLALCGPWGSGKTSIGNMVAEVVESGGDLWMPFNPWMFAGTDDLVGRFFGELALTLGKRDGRYRAVAQSLGRYAGALSKVARFVPVAGDPAAAVLESAERVAAGMGKGSTLDERRRTLVDALSQIDARIVVFLDDLDRLTDPEIREIVRLVKLVGDLPRITYILSFDRERVEEALGAPVIDPKAARERGRTYLEKIVQSRHDVPPLRDRVLIGFMAEQVEAAASPYGLPLEPESDWTNMVVLGVRRLLRTPRDARRIANAMPAAIELYGDEVALVDLFGLEVLRVLEPDVHAALPTIAEILVPGRLKIVDSTDEDRARLDEVLAHAREPEAVRQILGQLFTEPHQLLPVRGHREEQVERLAKRVATPAVLDVYLHLALDDDTLPTREIEQLAEALSDPAAFAVALERLPSRMLADAITRLLDHRTRFDPGKAVAVAEALMGVRHRLPPDASPFLTGRFAASDQLRFLIGHLLLAEQDAERRQRMTLELIDHAPNLSSRLELISWFGTHAAREGRDEDAEMVGEQQTAELLDDLRRRIIDAPPEALAMEPDLRRLLHGLGEETAGLMRQKAADDGFMLALVRAFFSEVLSRPGGDAAVHRIPKFDWTGLESVLGESHLRGRLIELERVRDELDGDDDTWSALDYALKVASGDAPANPFPAIP